MEEKAKKQPWQVTLFVIVMGVGIVHSIIYIYTGIEFVVKLIAKLF